MKLHVFTDVKFLLCMVKYLLRLEVGRNICIALANDVKTKTAAEMETGGKNYLLKSDKQSLGKWNNEIREFKFLCRKVMVAEQKLKKKAIELIGLLRKQYHLE